MPKLAPLDSGYRGPVAEYRKNQGSVGKVKIVFVGASYKFVHRVLRDMILVGGFDEAQVVVHDIDEVPMQIVGDLLERIARQQKTKIRVTKTPDLKEALRGAGAVILSITTGGRETDALSFEVCAKYGIPVGIGDTLGPAALARNLRTLPVVEKLAREMQRLCPEAVLLNFTNPMSCVTGTAARTGVPTYGLCHSTDALIQYFADVFRCRKSEVHLEAAGVNHQAFVTKLLVRGRDRTKEILAATERSRGGIADTLTGAHDDVKLQQDLCRVLGCWPSTGADHLAEFYRFFFTPRRAESLGLHAHLKKIVPGRKPFDRTPCPPIIHEWAYGPRPVGDLHRLTEEHAHELLWAHFAGEPYRRSLNILNTDECVRGIPRDACVEVMATVAGRMVRPDVVELPTAARALVHQWTSIHDLSIRAALHCDRDAARQALFLDPHVGDLYDIDGLLEDFLTVLKPWLPKGWFRD